MKFLADFVDSDATLIEAILTGYAAMNETIDRRADKDMRVYVEHALVSVSSSLLRVRALDASKSFSEIAHRVLLSVNAHDVSDDDLNEFDAVCDRISADVNRMNIPGTSKDALGRLILNASDTLHRYADFHRSQIAGI